MLHAVIMAGGSGTRFWPKSRRNRPKQLLRLHGDATMLQQTVERIAPLVPRERIFIITGADQAEATRAQLPGLPFENVVAEPCPRDTGPCVGLAAAIVAHADPDATMIVMPADHVIKPIERFVETVDAAVSVIDADPSTFVTFGIKPSRPETGYGYIERGDDLGKPFGIQMHQVRQFREKPNLETAIEFLKSGHFVWNSGIFLWRARTVLEALKQYSPGVYSKLSKIIPALGTPQSSQVIADEFPRMERVPIDKAVMEKVAAHIKVLEVTYDWSDVGDWRALNDLQAPDANGNTVQGAVHLVDTRDSIIVSDDGGLIATLGVNDLVVIQSGAATLVAHRDQLDKLKGLVDGLEKAGHGRIALRNPNRFDWRVELMGRVLGLDFGTKRVGAAISDIGRKYSSPLEVYVRNSSQADARHYLRLIEDEDVDRIIIGLPLHASGHAGGMADEARRWGLWLKELTGRPVHYFDERYSSIEADELMRESGLKASQRKKKIDMIAAQRVLQDYLDAGCPEGDPEEKSLDDERRR